MPKTADPTAAPRRHYSEMALADRQPAITDLIPTRAFSLLLLFLVGLLALAAINALNLQIVQQETNLTADQRAAFRLSGSDTLAGWFSSLLLLCGAALAWLIFIVRRHRVDDYRGRYRLWIWTAILLVYGSIDAQAGLHRTFGGQLSRLIGDAVAVDSVVWWIGLYVVVFGPLTIWMLLETKASRTALMLLTASITCYGVSALYALKWLPASAPTMSLQTMLEANFLLAGHFLLCCALTTFARYVNLDAHGKIKPRRPKVKKVVDGELTNSGGQVRKAAARAAAPSPQTSRRSDLESPPASQKRAAAAGTSSKPSANTKAAAPSAASPAGDDDLDPDQKLSKAERRRLRKLKRRQQRSVEA